MAKREIFKGKVKADRRKMSELINHYNDLDRIRIEKLKKDRSEDSKLRTSIHTDIKLLLSQGKTEIEIGIFLRNKYPNTNLEQYFDSWIEYHKNKKDYLIDDDIER